MKKLLWLLLLVSCTENNICQTQVRLKIVDEQIQKQVQVIKQIGLDPTNSDLETQESLLEDLLVEKAFLQLQDCN